MRLVDLGRVEHERNAFLPESAKKRLKFPGDLLSTLSDKQHRSAKPREAVVLAFRELEWKFSRPVFIGDTIRARIEITETKALARLGGGNVTMKVSVLNQDDEIVHRGHWQMLVKSKS